MFPPSARKIADGSFISHRGTGRSRKVNHVEALEADFGAPAAKIGSGVIEGVAKFDEHIERHEQTKNVLATGIVNERFNGDERAAGRQRIVGGADELHLFLEIPVVKD